jgi:hypothetical protein
MRRWLVLASLATLLIALLPASVQAAASSRSHEDSVILDCGSTSAEGFLTLFAVLNPEGSFAEVTFWATGTEPFEDEPTAFGGTEDVTGDATGMSATIDLFTIDSTPPPPVEVPAGSAVLDATLAPDGDPEPVDDRFKDGNRQERTTGTVQPLAATGSLDMPAGYPDLDLSAACFAIDQSLDFFSTNPSAYTNHFRSFEINCGWEAADGAFISLFAFADRFDAFGDVFIEIEDEEIGGGGPALLDKTSFAVGPFDLERFTSPGGIVGSAEAAAALTDTGESTRDSDTFGVERIKTFADIYAVDGELEVTLDGTTTTYPMDDEHCSAADQRVITHRVIPNGPKPKPLANDTPEGAVPARIGRGSRIVTGANAEAPEAPCTTIYPGQTEEEDVPITYTAWWTVTGTGGEMSVDTAGSTFDTVAGVYTLGAAGLEQVVCVDDVDDETGFSLQAKATWQSTAGVTYYLQLGGYGGDAGSLRFVVQ